MKTLEEHKKEFLRQAREFDTGRKMEDFHSYLRMNNLEHHLSETQIADRNRDSNGLNAYSLVNAIGIPLSLAAIYGVNRIPALSKNINSILFGESMYSTPNIERSLSGINSKPMPSAPAHIGQDLPDLDIAYVNGVPRLDIAFPGDTFPSF